MELTAMQAKHLWYKAIDKIASIRRSKSIVYNVCGGQIVRDKDYAFAFKVAQRIENYYKSKM